MALLAYKQPREFNLEVHHLALLRSRLAGCRLCASR